MMRQACLAILARVMAIGAGGFVAVDIQRVQSFAELIGQIDVGKAEVNLKACVSGGIRNSPQGNAGQPGDAVDDALLDLSAVLLDAIDAPKLSQCHRRSEF